MLANHVAVDNPSVDKMSILADSDTRIYLVKSSISVLEGNETLNHLNNILSTDILSLGAEGRLDGLICDSNGRVSDIISCYNMGESILILGLDSNAESTRELLTKGVPWNQEITLLDGNGALEHFRITGDDPLSVVEDIYPDLPKLSEKTYSEFENVMFSLVTYNGNQVIDVITRRDNSDFYNRVKESSLSIMSGDQWEVARIKLAYPGENEANTKYLPHDLGMGDLISLNKGCYPGQEIHARLDSRGRPKKRLAIIRTDRDLEIGKYVLTDGSTVNITSKAKQDEMYFSMGICSIDVSPDAKLELGKSDSKLILV